MEPLRGEEIAQLRQLLRLVIEHHTPTGPLPASSNASGEPATGSTDTPADRMHALAAFLARPAFGEELGPVDLLALRLLLDEYSAEVNRERRVAVATAQALDRVRETIRAVTKVQRDFRIYPTPARADRPSTEAG